MKRHHSVALVPKQFTTQIAAAKTLAPGDGH